MLCQLSYPCASRFPVGCFGRERAPPRIGEPAHRSGPHSVGVIGEAATCDERSRDGPDHERDPEIYLAANHNLYPACRDLAEIWLLPRHREERAARLPQPCRDLAATSPLRGESRATESTSACSSTTARWRTAPRAPDSGQRAGASRPSSKARRGDRRRGQRCSAGGLQAGGMHCFHASAGRETKAIVV